ncbi:SAM-dependent methyltransferase [Alkalihalobacillus sp. FSL W8-0930]
MSRAETSHYLELDRVIFIGRTFHEYMNIFGLNEQDLQGKKVLDCPAGACSFTAHAHSKGVDVTACDMAYTHSMQSLHEKGLEDVEYAMKGLSKAEDKYLWDYFKNVEDVKEHRLAALADCTDHMRTYPERYVSAMLPVLPFADQQFDLTLSAHFLFMYSDRLDQAFHLKTIKELLRVTKKELRLFPLVDLEGARYAALDQVKATLIEEGYSVSEVRTTYEFHRNAHTMLVIKR